MIPRLHYSYRQLPTVRLPTARCNASSRVKSDWFLNPKNIIPEVTSLITLVSIALLAGIGAFVHHAIKDNELRLRHRSAEDDLPDEQLRKALELDGKEGKVEGKAESK